MPSVIAHYQEIALKGKNRNWFLQRLIRNLRAALAGLDVPAIRTPMGRIEIALGRDADWPEVRDRLGRVFGLANFALAREAPWDLDALAAAVVEHLPADAAGSFRVAARRADKRFPHASPEIERVVGRRVQDGRRLTVDLSNPEMVIGIEVVPQSAFYYYEKHQGPGGLPTGTGGRVVALLSGGIDSPVAAWRIMRRGCRVVLVHFHSYPYLSRTSQDKARELAQLLTRYQLQSRLFVVAFGDVQRQVTLSVPGPLRVIVYRRLMLRIAERIAQTVRAQALVTGEVIGQVASQTLDNMTLIAGATRLPVFRPLVGMDKEEITLEARRLGSYPISIVPDEDCCTLFTPRHPETRGRPAQIEAAERDLPIEQMVAEAVDRAVVESFGYPPGRAGRAAAAAVEPAAAGEPADSSGRS